MRDTLAAVVWDGREPAAVASANPMRCLLYGPYVNLPAGRYRVHFGVSAREASVDPAQACGHVDVAADLGTQVLAKAGFGFAEISAPGATLTLEFSLATARVVEFRVFTYDACALDVCLDRFLEMIDDQLLPHACAGPNQPYEAVVYNEFILRNLERLRAIANHGAIIESFERAAKVTLFGVTLLVENDDDFQIIIEVLIHNVYAFEIGRPSCVIDIGMNVGLASLFFAYKSYVEEVHAFEPFHVPFARAQKNFRLNPSISQKIKPVNIGLSDRTMSQTVLYNDTGTVGASVLGLEHGRPTAINLCHAAEVLGPIISDAKQRNLAIAMKIDCEGSEFGIFEVLISSGLIDQVDVYLIEWHKWWSKTKTQRDLLIPLLARGYIALDHTIAANPDAGQIYAIKSSFTAARRHDNSVGE